MQANSSPIAVQRRFSCKSAPNDDNEKIKPKYVKKRKNHKKNIKNVVFLNEAKRKISI